MRHFPPLYYVVWGLCAGKILVAVFDFVGGFIGEPVIPDLLDFLVAVLTQAQEEEVVVHKRELAPVVICGVVALVRHQLWEVIIRILR